MNFVYKLLFVQILTGMELCSHSQMYHVEHEHTLLQFCNIHICSHLFFFFPLQQQSKPCEFFLRLLVNVLEEAVLLIGENKSMIGLYYLLTKQQGQQWRFFQVGLLNFCQQFQASLLIYSWGSNFLFHKYNYISSINVILKKSS